MSLAGTGLVAIWHDITPEGGGEFYERHNREHMPERVAIPGFIRGRRYIAERAAPEFFNLYEAETIGVLRGPRVQPCGHTGYNVVARVAMSSGGHPV